MRKALAFLAFLLPILSLCAGTVDPTYTFQDFQTTPQAVRKITQTPLKPMADYGGAILSAKPSSQNTSGAGSATFSNTVAGYAYRIQLDTPYGSTIRTCAYPATLTGPVTASVYLGNLVGQDFYYLYPVPSLATNYDTATDGQLMSKSGDKIKFITASGTGDALQAGQNNFTASNNVKTATITNLFIPVGAVSNYVWTATNANGSGAWMAASASSGKEVAASTNTITITNGSGVSVALVGSPAFNAVNVTNLPAANLFGTVADGRLSANIPRLSGSNTYFGYGIFNLAGSSNAPVPTVAQAGATSPFFRRNNGTDALIWDENDLAFEYSADVNLLTHDIFGSAFWISGGSAHFNTDVAASTFSGSGVNLTDLNGTQITSGTIPDSRLSSNVPLKNGNNILTGTNTIPYYASTNANSIFTGSNLISGPVITVYPSGVAIGPSGVINTIGTTTMGMQEAVYSLSQLSSVGPQIGGGEIQLVSGDYWISNSIIIPQTFAFNLKISGAGEGSTRLIYAANTNRDFIVTSNNTSGTFSTLNFVMRDLGLFHLWDTNHTALIHFGDVNQLLMENVFIAPYQMLYQTSFRNPLVYFNPPTNKVGTVGIRIDTGSNRETFRNVYFHGLAGGLWSTGDHMTLEDCIWSDCGQYQLNGAGPNSWGTTYTTAANQAFTNIAAYGFGCAFPANTYEVNIKDGQWFNDHAAIYAHSTGNGPYLTAYNPMVEACLTRCLLGDGNDGIDVSIAMLHGMAPGNGTDLGMLYKTGATEANLSTGHPYAVVDLYNKSGIFENGDFISRATLAGSNVWSFSGSFDTGNWFYQGGLAVGQDSGPTAGFNFEAVGNTRINGVLTFVNTNAVPLNTTTVRAWMTVTNAGQQFKMPLYQ